jgi:hypothetical protein
LWWVAHVAEVLLVLAVVLAVAAALLGLLPDADLSGLFDPNPARAEAR